MDSITVKNASGQIAQIGFPDNDPRTKARRDILEQRIARGELEKASGKSGGDPAGRAAVVDYHTGLRDEKGDLLKSVHGGGVDPDAEGDALGQPSGSEAVKGAVESGADEPVGDSHPDAAPAAKKSSKK